MQTGKARGLGSAVQQVVQGFEQFFAVIPAERQFRAVGQLDGVIAMKDRLQLPDVIDVDEIGPMIREQVLNRQLVLYLRDGPPKERECLPRKKW